MGYPRPPATAARRFPHGVQLGRDIVLQFGEIQKCVENLRNIETYLRRFPYPHAGISKSSYMRYHVESYFNELYILKERLCAYLTMILRRYRYDRDARRFKKVIEAVRQLVESSLTGVVTARGAHVHQRRYDDPELGRVGLFELLALGDEKYKSDHERVYREVRKSKRDWIKKNNDVIIQLLDAYCEALIKLLFKDGTLRLPQSPRKNDLRRHTSV